MKKAKNRMCKLLFLVCIVSIIQPTVAFAEERIPSFIYQINENTNKAITTGLSVTSNDQNYAT